MAACTNNGGSRARRAVTAALVGVLSVGAVPMAAIAEGVSDAISPLFVADDTEFSNGTATLEFNRIDADGTVVEGYTDTVSPDENGVDVITMTEAGEAYVPYVTAVSPAGSGKTEVITSSTISNYRIRLYKAGEDGKPTGSPLSGNKATDAGEYVLTVTALSGSEFEGQVFTKSFKLVGEALPTSIVAYENDNEDDTGFRFTGSALDVSFKGLVEGRDYTVEYVRGGKTVDSVTSAGDYTAKLTGQGLYAGSTASTVIHVDPFSLYGATVVVNDFTGETPTTPDYVYRTDTENGKQFTTVLDPSVVQLETSGTVSDANTTPINFTAKAAEGVSTDDVMGEKTDVQAHKVDTLCTYTYNGEALQDSYELDASKNQAFNVGSIKAFFGTNDVTSSISDIDVQKTKGTIVNTSDDGDSDLTAGVYGEYAVTISVPATYDPTTKKVYSGSKTFTVKIWKGIIDADASIYVYGPDSLKAITSYEKPYDGETLDESRFTVGTKNAAVAADLKKTVVDADGNTVDAAVDAGEYKLVVTSDWYKLSGTTELPITINKVDLTTLEIGELEKWNNVAGEEYLPLDETYKFDTIDNAIIDLGIVFSTGNDGLAYDEIGWVGDDCKGQDYVPGNVDFIVEKNVDGTWKDVASIDNTKKDAPGEYRLTATVAEDVASNYVLPEGETSVTLNFTVAWRGTFSDVQPSDWCYSAVENANYLGYMNGYGDTNVFGANDLLTRGQAVSVLYKMSGASASDTNAEYNEHTGWVTGYDDVDGKMFYAEAIAWAKATGVVNGYDATHFGPEDPVTREQFAGMLSNYAKVVNRDETVGTADVEAVLAEFPDGSQVSDWAAEAVAWAASATDDRGAVMGNNGTLMPGNTISRAEVAAMAVNYQPINKNNVSAIF